MPSFDVGKIIRVVNYWESGIDDMLMLFCRYCTIDGGYVHNKDCGEGRIVA